MKRKKYSLKERQAYWIGVGIASAVFKEHNSLLNSSNPKIKKSIQSGFKADNLKNISKKFK